MKFHQKVQHAAILFLWSEGVKPVDLLVDIIQIKPYRYAYLSQSKSTKGTRNSQTVRYYWPMLTVQFSPIELHEQISTSLIHYRINSEAWSSDLMKTTNLRCMNIHSQPKDFFARIQNMEEHRLSVFDSLCTKNSSNLRVTNPASPYIKFPFESQIALTKNN